MDLMKKWVGWVLLALSLYATYEGWRNSQPTPETEALSKPEACKGREACTLAAERPTEIRTNFFGRTCCTAPGPLPPRRPREPAPSLEGSSPRIGGLSRPPDASIRWG